MRIGLGSDEIGFECKQRLRATVSGHGHAIEDVSTLDSSRSDIYCLAPQQFVLQERINRETLLSASDSRIRRSSQLYLETWWA